MDFNQPHNFVLSSRSICCCRFPRSSVHSLVSIQLVHGFSYCELGIQLSKGYSVSYFLSINFPTPKVLWFSPLIFLLGLVFINSSHDTCSKVSWGITIRCLCSVQSLYSKGLLFQSYFGSYFGRKLRYISSLFWNAFLSITWSKISLWTSHVLSRKTHKICLFLSWYLPIDTIGRGQQRMRWSDGITNSMGITWANSRRWWGTGRPGMLQSMGS